MIKHFYFKQFSLACQHRMFQVFLWITNNSVKHESFIYSQMIKQFYFSQFSLA